MRHPKIQTIHGKEKSRNHYLIYIFFSFLFIVFFLFITSSGGNFNITGNLISENFNENLNLTKELKINAELSKTSFNLKTDIEKVSIEGRSDSYLYAGDQKFSLSNKSSNYIVLDEFDGDLYFNEDSVSKLKGKAENAEINGVKVSSKSGRRIEVELDKELDFLELDLNGFKLSRISYITSGKIEIGNDKFNLNDEKLVINSFSGNLKMNDEMTLKGNIDNMDIIGDSKISVN